MKRIIFCLCFALNVQNFLNVLLYAGEISFTSIHKRTFWHRCNGALELLVWFCYITEHSLSHSPSTVAVCSPLTLGVEWKRNSSDVKIVRTTIFLCKQWQCISSFSEIRSRDVSKTYCCPLSSTIGLWIFELKLKCSKFSCRYLFMILPKTECEMKENLVAFKFSNSVYFSRRILTSLW